MIRTWSGIFLVFITAVTSAYAAQAQTPVLPGQTEADVRRMLGEPEQTEVNVYKENTFIYSARGMTVEFSPRSGLVSGVVLGNNYPGKIAGDVDMTFTKDRVFQALGAGTPLPEENFSDSEAYSWDLGGTFALFQFHNTAGSILYVVISS